MPLSKATPADHAAPRSSASRDLTPAGVQEAMASIDRRVGEQRRLNEQAEREMFGGDVQGERRAALTLSIALRDELIEELLERRELLELASGLLVGRQG